MVLCTSCGTEQQSGAKFCDECGARLAVACGSCGVELRPGARFCSECGASQAEVSAPAVPAAPERPSAVAERKVTSVLFGDLVGFTSLSETRDKEDVRDLLSEYFAQCRRIVARYGGTVEKFIGDAVMAVWGVPAAHEDDAERAVRAGLELVRAVESLGEELKVAGLVLRVGIVTGEVAVTLGADHEGMVAGDAVNTAARVQSVAEPGQVWVDETTRLLTSGAITYVDVGSHPLKGKADPVPLWAVRAVVAAIGGAQRADGLEAPLTGRARELRLVKELLHGVEETGRPALALVNGDPGLGKSRLAWEFEKYIDGLQVSFAWHSSRCLSYGEGVAFWPIAEAVRGRLGIVESDPDADPVAALDAWFARCVPDEEEAAWLRPRILVLLGRGSSGGYERDDLFSAWRTFFERTQEERAAVVLLIDDAQHADDGTVQFVEHLLSTSDAPLFVMLMARPELLERWPSLATNRRATVLHLATLEAQELADLLDGLVSGLPDDVREGLVERAQGVPLYAIETVRSLIDRDLVVPRGGVYVLSDPDSVDLASIGAPASLQALVAARLDGLPPEQRRVVTDASVLGLTFTREAIAALSGNPPDLDDTLTALTRLEILGTVGSRLSAEYGQYRFIQAVVRQVAYSTQARRDRKARHLAVADYFRAMADPSGDHAPVLAQHYLDAIDASGDADVDLPDLRRLAVTNLSDAASRARELGAPAEALRYLETALAHVTDDVGRAPIHLAAAWAAHDAAEVDSSMEHSRLALDLFTAAGDRLGAGGAAAVRAQCLTRLLFASQEALEVALPHWEALQDVPGAEVVLLALARPIANSYLTLGEDASEVALARLRIAESIGDRQTIADAIMSFASAHSAVRPTLAMALFRSSIEIAREEQRPRMASIGLANLALIVLPHSLGECLSLLDEAAEATGKGGSDPYAVTLNSLNVAWASFLSGSWQTAEQLLDDVPDIAHAPFFRPCIDAMLSDATGRSRRYPAVPINDRDTADEGLTAYLMLTLALEARAGGDLGTAATLGAEAFELIFDFVGLFDDAVHMWPVAVELALYANDADALRRTLAPIDDAPQGLLGIAWKAHRHRFAGLVAIDGGATDQVEPNLRAAIALFDEWGSPPYKAKAQADLAVWLEGQGRVDEAAPLKQAALEVLQGLGANGWLANLGWTTIPAAAAP